MTSMESRNLWGRQEARNDMHHVCKNIRLREKSVHRKFISMYIMNACGYALRGIPAPLPKERISKSPSPTTHLNPQDAWCSIDELYSNQNLHMVPMTMDANLQQLHNHISPIYVLGDLAKVLPLGNMGDPQPPKLCQVHGARIQRVFKRISRARVVEKAARNWNLMAAAAAASSFKPWCCPLFVRGWWVVSMSYFNKESWW